LIEKSFLVFPACSRSSLCHLLVYPNGSKYWRMAYRFGNKQKLLAIGKYPVIPLSQARVKRDEAKVKALIPYAINASAVAGSEIGCSIGSFRFFMLGSFI